MLNSLSGELTGKGLSRRTSTSVNTAAVEPILRARTTKTVAVNVRARSRNRMPKRKSCISASTCRPASEVIRRSIPRWTEARRQPLLLSPSKRDGGQRFTALPAIHTPEMVRVFLPEGSNETRLVDQVDTHLNRIADLGFVRRLRGQEHMIEVLRILKAFVDAQWLSEFDARLAAYQAQLGGTADEE